MLSSRKHHLLVLVVALIAAAYVIMPTRVGHEIIDHISSPKTSNGSAVQTAAAPVFSLELLAGDLVMPVDVIESPDESGRLFVVEKTGVVKIIKNGAVLARPYFDIHSEVSDANEQGLLSLAFHPEFASNGRLFIDYTDRNGDTRIEELIAGNPAGDEIDGSKRRLVLFYKQPYRNHNGGQLLFGPDNFLYIPSGDGGSAGDPQNNAQNLNSLLGKILRIDINMNQSVDFNSGASYGIPADNPFVSRDNVRPEIWAYGMRNPWRCAFDRGSKGRLFCADVGQNDFEEVDLIERGGNYGWPMYEGRSCYKAPCDPAGKLMPISEYNHDSGISITGGFVYRGEALPELFGQYVFGDFGKGTIWSIPADSARQGTQLALIKRLETKYLISSFGEGRRGEGYLADYKGNIFKFVPAPRP